MTRLLKKKFFLFVGFVFNTCYLKYSHIMTILGYAADYMGTVNRLIQSLMSR